MSATQNADEHSTVQPTEEQTRREPRPREAGFWAWLTSISGLVVAGSVLAVGELPVLAVGIGLLALVVMLGTARRAMAALEGGEPA